MASRQNSWKRGFNFIIRFFKGILELCQAGVLGFSKSLGRLHPIGKYLIGSKLVISTLLLILLFSGIVLAAILPTQDKFEGNLLVEKLSFITEREDKLFLKDIRSLNKLEVKGKQTLTLIGSFESEEQSLLNKVSELKIEPLSDSSTWTLAPANSQKPSQLELKALTLQANTAVTELSYNSFEYRLFLSLEADKNSVYSSASNVLELYLGEEPLKLKVEGYRLSSPELNQKESRAIPDSIGLTFIPNISEYNLTLSGTNSLVFYLPNPTDKKMDSIQWFWGDLSVQDVKFYETQHIPSDLTSAERDDSTILNGKIRMSGRELILESGQFISIKNPGIKRLIRIQIKHPNGLEIRFSGESKGIEVGLDPRLPISNIQSTYLSKRFPNDIVIAIISFCSATVVSLISWLVQNKASQETSSNSARDWRKKDTSVEITGTDRDVIGGEGTEKRTL